LKKAEQDVVRGNETVNLIWLGTAGVLISDGNTDILIDPYVSRFGILKIALGLSLRPDKKAVKRWIALLGIKNINAVVVSHSHFDHCLDAPYFAIETGAALIGSESTMNVGRGAGLAEKYLKIVNTDHTIKVGEFGLIFIESAHGPAFLGRVPYPGAIDKPLFSPRPARDYKLGKTYSILITHPTGQIVHHGSAGFIPGMYEGCKADVVLLGIAGRGDTQQYLENVPLKLGAKLIIPIHFDNFFIPLEKKMKYLPEVKINEFLAVAKRHHDAFELKILPLGEKTPVLPLP
jgi:L-ascorbate metabolism protein UlaG (beta-lactamase superfamily)